MNFQYKTHKDNFIRVEMTVVHFGGNPHCKIQKFKNRHPLIIASRILISSLLLSRVHCGHHNSIRFLSNSIERGFFKDELILV